MIYLKYVFNLWFSRDEVARDDDKGITYYLDGCVFRSAKWWLYELEKMCNNIWLWPIVMLLFLALFFYYFGLMLLPTIAFYVIGMFLAKILILFNIPIVFLVAILIFALLYLLLMASLIILCFFHDRVSDCWHFKEKKLTYIRAKLYYEDWPMWFSAFINFLVGVYLICQMLQAVL